MRYAITIMADDRSTAPSRPAGALSAQTMCGAAALTFSVAIGAWGLITSRAAIDMTDRAVVVASAATTAMPRPAPPRPSLEVLLDPRFVVTGARPLVLAESAPLAAVFARPAPVGGAPVVVAAAPFAEPPAQAGASAVVAAADLPATSPLEQQDDTAAAPMPIPMPVPTVVQVADGVPLPTPRPHDFSAGPAPEPAPSRVPTRRIAGRSRPGPMVASASLPDNRTFFEKLFGMPQQPAGPVLAYAAPEDGVVGALRGMASGSMSPYDRQTAVYDITAHTVYLPDGTRLEAHSGLGAMLDDPRHVSQRMRGPTPPHLYELTPREALFHGVRALRLNPVGGGGVFGRNGLLAHTFMLGPNGDSNGCVSFRNYDAFLQAFQRGQVKRLAVVTHLS